MGLGNPGSRYKNTRHNVGCMVADILSEEYRIPINQKEADYRFGSGLIHAQPVLLVKPLTFMNRTGTAVRQLLTDYHESVSQIIIIHDDLDIPLGQIRIKLKGGAGGHNGLTSIIDALQTDLFLRIRVGIGRPVSKEEVISFVLSPFLRTEKAVLNEVIRKAAEAVGEVITQGPQKAMTLYNRRRA